MTDLPSPTQDKGEVLAPAAAPLLSAIDFRSVYEENFAYIWAVLRRLGVYDRELEDAVHDVFIVFHRRLGDFDAARPVRPWLCGIATRVAADFRRRARVRHETATAAPDAVASDRSPEQGAAANEARALVRRALDELAWERRVMIVLCDLEGYSVPALQDVLEVPLNTLYSRLRLARRDFTAAVRRLQGEEAR